MTVTSPAGFRAAGVAAGLKSGGRRDVALVVNEGPLQVGAGVFTTNRVVAAPVTWTRQVVSDGVVGAAVLNSGGANACTGPDGYADTHQTAEHVAAALGISAGDVAVCSTGLIGLPLDMPALLPAISAAAGALRSDGGHDAAEAIMTTDSVAKTAHATGDGWSIGGMAKGAGMLAPGLATMLCVLTTDAVLSAPVADAALREATRVTFDRVDSDGCMSTNDTVLLLASGASGVEPSAWEFETVLRQACAQLARALVADAEGASHDIAIRVHGAVNEDEAVAVGRAVARSNLFKAAVFGNDPNWGRVLSAVGTVPEHVATFDADRVDVAINGVTVCRDGGVGEDRSLVSMAEREVWVDVDLKAVADGSEATVWTNDLTHAYVHENSAYST